MQRALNLALAVLLILSIGVCFAEAADLLPCPDGDQGAAIAMQATSVTVHHEADPRVDHCRAVSPLGATLLPTSEAEGIVSGDSTAYFHQPSVMPAGIVPGPPHGPPRI